jgi:hypothetical protein
VSSDGVLIVRVPPGALGSNTALSVQLITSPGAGSLGPTYALEPSGMRFTQLVGLTFHYGGMNLGMRDPQTLNVATFVAGAWSGVPSTVNLMAQTVWAGVAHFSPWGIISAPVPAPPSQCGYPIRVAAGGGHTCATTSEGEVWCWGHNAFGQCVGSLTQDPLLTQQATGVFNAVDVVAGTNHTCALLANKTVSCWGDNMYGECATGDYQSPVLQPTQVSSSGQPLAGITQLSSRGLYTCALRIDGAVLCWGQLNPNAGVFPKSSVPSLIDFKNASASSVAVGANHACAVTTLGVMCWGTDSWSELGDGLTTDQQSPVQVLSTLQVPPPALGVAAIAVGDQHTCALLSDHSVRCWGDNSHRQLGNGDAKAIPAGTSVVVAQGLLSFTALSAGQFYNCAAANGVWCWGSNDASQLGFPHPMTPGDDLDPSGIPTLGTTSPTMIDTSDDGENDVGLFSPPPTQSPHVCAVFPDTFVRCWGDDQWGELGDNTQQLSSPTPNAVWPGPLTSGDTLCSGECVNTSTDDNNCGSCGAKCPTGTTCRGSNGLCTCTTGQACVEYCCNSGGCAICMAGQTCEGGQCVIPCPSGQYSCFGAFCCPNGTSCDMCVSGPACAIGETPCGNACCSPGQSCVNGACQ